MKKKRGRVQLKRFSGQSIIQIGSVIRIGVMVDEHDLIPGPCWSTPGVPVQMRASLDCVFVNIR